jgi:hypothetical protein
VQDFKPALLYLKWFMPLSNEILHVQKGSVSNKIQYATLLVMHISSPY